MIPPSLLVSMLGTPSPLPGHLGDLFQPEDESGSARAADTPQAQARRLFAGALVWLHARYPYAEAAELAAMANALSQAATGHDLEGELMIPSELFRRARVALAAGLRGSGPIHDPLEALQTAVAVMAQGVSGHFKP